MKDCPRCGSTLSHYAHGDGEAYGCDACGWVGVDVEHRSEPVRLESWTDAITRFEAKFGSKSRDDVPGTLDRVDDPIEVPDDAESDPEPSVDRVPSNDSVDDGDPIEEPDADDSSTDADTDESDAELDDEDGIENEDATADTEDDSVDDENQAEAA
jgi:hypothetical protein